MLTCHLIVPQFPVLIFDVFMLPCLHNVFLILDTFNLYFTQCTVHVYSCILVMKLLARDESLKQVHSGEDYQKTGDLQKLTAE